MDKLLKTLRAALVLLLVSGCLASTSTVSTSSSTTFTKTQYQKTNRLNFRSSLQTSGKVLMLIPSGTVFNSLVIKQNCHTVQYRSKAVYVMGTYLKKGISIPASTIGNVDYSGSKV